MNPSAKSQLVLHTKWSWHPNQILLGLLPWGVLCTHCLSIVSAGTRIFQIQATASTILLIGGEHARELITSEILLWLGLVLTGQENGFSKWPASVEVATQRKAIGLGRSILADWVQSLLLKVVFKVGASRDGNRPAVLQMVTSGTSCVLPVHETHCFQAYLTGC